MNPIQFNNSTQSTEFVKSSTHESSTSNKFKAIALGLLALSGGAAAEDTCQLDYVAKPCYNSWRLGNEFSSIPFIKDDYEAPRETIFEDCMKRSYDYRKNGDDMAATRTRGYCLNDRVELDQNLRQIFEDVATQERTYQSATKKLTIECEFWKNIAAMLADEKAELFSLNTQGVSWELSVFPDATDMNEKVQVFRNGAPDYCLKPDHWWFLSHQECADLSFAKSYETELLSLNPSTLKETAVKQTTDRSQFLDVRSLKRTVEKIKESVASNDPNQHETANQSITGTSENSKMEIVENIKKACDSHRRKASENAFKFWANEKKTSWVVADQNDNVFYSFTLKA